MKSGLVRGLVLIGVGAFIIYWAVTHSPKAGVGQMITNELSGSYTMSEGAYYASLVVGTILAVLGLLRTYKSLK
jgi:TRAP-type C4-dicarboxylate transport system permease small subunit